MPEILADRKHGAKVQISDEAHWIHFETAFSGAGAAHLIHGVQKISELEIFQMVDLQWISVGKFRLVRIDSEADNQTTG